MTGFIIVLFCVAGSVYVGLRQHTPRKNKLYPAARMAGLKLRSVRDYYFFDHHPLGVFFNKKEDLYAYDLMTSETMTAFHVHYRTKNNEHMDTRHLFIITKPYTQKTASHAPLPSNIFDHIQSKLHMWGNSDKPLIIETDTLYAHLYFNILDPDQLSERLSLFNANYT
jgi:hypothetical protein